MTQAVTLREDAGFDRLVRAESTGLKALARRLVPDASDAEDVVQGALEDAWSARASLQSPDAAPAWLRRIVVHRALSAMRRRRLWKAIGALLLLAPEEVAAGPDAALAKATHLRGLAVALEALPARQAAAFTLRYLEGLDFSAVADALGCARGTARIHVQRAVKALREAGALTEESPP